MRLGRGARHLQGEYAVKKIGVISDVHGNLQALQKALDFLNKQQCEQIIHTGDVVDIGANCKECLQLLLQNNVLCLLGNHDRDFVANNARHGSLSHVSARHKRFVFNSLQGFEHVVEKFPTSHTAILGGKKVLFQHYCFSKNPQSGYLFAPIENYPTAAKFDEMYGECDFDAVFFGHKHEPCDKIGKRLYVDVGSVGCHPEPLATGIVITYDDAQFRYDRFAIPYNQEETRKAMTESDLPDGQYLFDFYFLHKPNLPDVVE